MLKDGLDIRAIGNTDAAKFLNDPDFKKAINAATKSDARIVGSAANLFLEATDGLWGDLSERFARETTGKVQIVLGDFKADRIFNIRELPQILAQIKSGAITEFAGVSSETFAKLSSDTERINLLLIKGFAETEVGGIKAGDWTKFLNLNEKTLGEALATLDDPTSVRLKDLGSKYPISGETTKVLSKLGWAGAGLVLLLTSFNAGAAALDGRTDDALHTVEDFVTENAGSILAGEAAGIIATVGLVLIGGTIGAPVAACVILGAALAGGYFGGEKAKEWTYLFQDHTEEHNRDLTERLFKLLFGDDYKSNLSNLDIPTSLKGGNKLTIDCNFGRDKIVESAKTDVAWRYALRELNPFVILDDSLYEKHNSDGSLDLYDPATDTGTMTNLYLQDRAAMLTWKIRYDKENKIYSAEYGTEEVEGNWDFVDIGSGITLQIDGKGASAYDHQIVFGTKNNDVFNGSGDSDHLYGMAGDDVIDGGKGDDYVEGGLGNDTLSGGDDADRLWGGKGNDALNGGAGNDFLEGGEGDDIYRFVDAYGVDIISDSDGSGTIKVDTKTVANAKQKSENIYQDDISGQTIVKLNDGKSLVILQDGNANRVIVNAWSDAKNLGIILDGTTPVAPEATLTGDFKKAIDIKDAADPDDDVYEFVGGNYVSAGKEANAADLITGTAGNDVVDGGGGDDALSGKTGDDTILGGAGSDIIQGGQGKDTLYGGAGDDAIYGSSDADLGNPILINFTRPTNTAPHPQGTGFNWFAGYTSTIGDDVPSGYSNAPRNRLDDDKGNIIDGGIGNDFIAAGTGADVVLGGADNDRIYGMDKDDILFGDGGNDVIYGDGNQPGNDSVVWTLYENHGKDVIDGGSGNDYLYGQGGDDIIFGGEGNDKIWGDDDEANLPVAYHGNDFLFGGSGTDELRGGAGDDYLEGGTGDDSIWGGAGDDVYFYNAGDGVDNLYDNKGEKNIIRFGAGVDSSQIKLKLGSLMLDMGNGDAIHIGNYDQNDVFNSSSVTQFEFVDGDSLSLSELLARGFDLEGTDGSDYIAGTNTDDRIDGKGGTDALLGCAGNDTYIFRTGDSPSLNESAQQSVEWVQDTSGTDTIQFVDVAPASIQVQTTAVGLPGDDGLLIEYGTSDRLLVLDGKHGAMERFEVGGASLTFSEFIGRYSASIIRGADADGRLLLNGGKTDDLLVADQTNAKVSGGLGNDTLRLSGDGATIAYSLGDGKDFITTGGDDNVLSLGKGITLTDITVVSANDGALILQVGTDASDQISFSSFSAKSPLSIKPFDRIAVADGSAVTYEDFVSQGFSLAGTDTNDTLYGLTGNDDLDGGLGNDLMIGSAGSDVYHWGIGSGQDIIDNSGNVDRDADTLEIAEGLSADTLQFIRRGNDLLIRRLDGSEQVTVLDHYGTGAIGAVEFADGTRWEAADIAQNSIDMFVLVGQQGAVSVEETSSLGAIVQLGAGLNFTDLIATQSGDDLLLQVRGTESSLRLQNYYQTDPTIWSVVDADGGMTTLDSLQEATAALQADIVASLKQDFMTWAKQSLANQLSSDGYALAEDGSWQKTSTWFGTSNTYSRSDQVTSTTTTWFDGRLPSTTVATFLNESWNRTSWGNGPPSFGLAEWEATIQETHEIGTEDVIYCDNYESSSISSQGWVEVHWAVQNVYSHSSEYQNSNGVYSSVSGVLETVGYQQSTTTIDSTQTTYAAVLNQALTVGNVQTDLSAINAALPNALPGMVTLAQETYSIEEIVLTDADHVVFGNAQSMVIAGVGNNWIYNAGFAYGGIGDSHLVGGHILVAGKGQQWLQDGDVMVVGDGSDTVIANAGNEIYVQHANTDVDLITSDANQGETLLDQLYTELGIEGWQESYEYGGYYRCNNDGGYFYSNSPSDVLEFYQDWRNPPETFQQVLNRGWAVYVEPLPTLITVLDLSISASSYYDLHRVAKQTIYASQWEKLEAYVDDGTLTPTTIKFDEGLALSDIAFSWDYVASPGNGLVHVALSLKWGNEQGIEVLIPNSSDVVGQGLYHFEFADGSSLSLTEIMALAPDAPDFDPDFFEFGSESGEVVIECYEYRGIRVSDGLSEADLSFTHEGSDLLITYLSTDSVLRIVDWYADPSTPSRMVLKFADGTFCDATKLTQLGMVIDGSAGGQTIESVQGFAMTFIAGPGDTLIGHNPGDLYQYVAGSGVVHIQDYGGGIIQFGAGITREMISLGLGSLLLRIGDQGDEIHLDNFDPEHADAATTVQYFMFADGTELSYQELVARGFDIYGTSGDDVLTGTNLDNRIYGGDGDDILVASGQCDYLYAGAGNDLLIANDGGDVLIGGSGRTEFHTQVGNGMLTIDDSVVKTSSTESDFLFWDGEITAQDISISFVDGDVLLLNNANEGDGVILSCYFEGTANNLPRIEFADGSYILGETVDGVFVLTCYDSTGQANGERWEFHQYEDGNWSWSTSNDATPDSDGVYQQFTRWSNGDYQEKYYDPERNETWGVLSRAAEGCLYHFDTISNPSGMIETWDWYEYNDESNYGIHRIQQSDGSYSLDWSRSDGTSGTEEQASDGTRIVICHAAAGDYTQTTTRPDGSSLVENFDGTGFLQSDTWVAADGSSGNDWYNTDGSNSFTKTRRDGVVTHGGLNVDGSEGTETRDAAGLLIGDSWIAVDGSQRVDAGGNTLLVGTTGNDFLHGGTGKALLAGGEGNDVLQLGGDSDIVAFNVGDGLDTVISGLGSANILSLGGVLNSGDLAFEKLGNNLVLEIGSDDSLTFENWYGSSANQSFTTLQLSSSELGDTAEVDQYNLSQLVAAFDTARAADSMMTAWQLSTELLNARLNISSDSTLGGDLTFSYATQGNLGGMGVFAAQATLSSTLFATAPQPLGQANSVGSEIAYLR